MSDNEAGMKVRREVLGDAHVDRAIATTTNFNRPFQEFITHYAWGSVWTRDGLDRRTRSAITLAVLTALGRENEIAMHVRAARTNGLTPDEISEVLLHAAVYAGVPAVLGWRSESSRAPLLRRVQQLDGVPSGLSQRSGSTGECGTHAAWLSWPGVGARVRRGVRFASAGH